MNNDIRIQYHSLKDAVHTALGEHVEITGTSRVHGGDINHAFRLSLSTGETVFVKTNSIQNADFFTAEACGLLSLSSTETIGVPRFLELGIDQQQNLSFLLLEYIESISPSKTYWETFGQKLAYMHQADPFQASGLHPARYGFPEDNFIGASPQKNLPKESWIDFYRECRLIPQIEMAGHYFDSGIKKKFLYLLEHLDSYLREPPFLSLLHGDLWSGNVLCGSGGKAWVVDPAVYVGDFETDLAMTQLFGSFPAAFYSAYQEINPIDKGYAVRRELYHLYHLLNHLNLFGRMYLGSVTEILNKYI